MKQEVELIRYLPEFLQRMKEYQELFRAENPEFMLLYEMADALLDNGFIRTADLQGLKRWEQLLGILSSGQDLVGRQAAVLGKWNRSLPYTMARLYEYLDILAAREKYHILLSPEDYRFELVTENLPSGILRAMQDMVQEMLPANMFFVLADQILGEVALQLALQAHIRITGAFYPRSNVPLYRLDGTTRLDGGYPLNGYLSGETLDFYPVSLRVGCGVGQAWLVSFWSRTAFCAAATQDVRGSTALLVRGTGECTTGTQARTQVAAGAGESGWASAAGHLRVEKAWGTLDGSRRLDGGRRLDAARYAVGL